MTAIILMGAPGSGKGTNAKFIQEKLGLNHLSTGDMLRSEIENETQLGQKIKEKMKTGELISDLLMRDLVNSGISDLKVKQNFILDGYPRNLIQAKDLDTIFDTNNVGRYFVIQLQVDEDIIKKRITGRYTCAKCGAIYNKFFTPTKTDNKCDVCGSEKFITREDDTLETIMNRLDIYKQETQPVIDYYKSKGLCHEINADKGKEYVFKEICKLINK